MVRSSWLFLAGCLVLFLAGCEEPSSPSQAVSSSEDTTPSMLSDSCNLSFGWDPWAPYQYLTPDDEVAGLEIELVKAMAKRADCNLRFVQKNWMSLLNDIRAGKIDVLGGASQTKAREKFAQFSMPYRQESFVLYIRTGELEKYQSPDLRALLDKGFKLGVTQDYVYGSDVTELQNLAQYQENFVSVATSEENYFNLTQKHIDGFLEDPFVATYTIKGKGLQEQIEAHTIEIYSGDVALMFSKRSVDPQIVVAFNKALMEMQKSGEYQKILAKYSR